MRITNHPKWSYVHELVLVIKLPSVLASLKLFFVCSLNFELCTARLIDFLFYESWLWHIKYFDSWPRFWRNGSSITSIKQLEQNKQITLWTWVKKMHALIVLGHVLLFFAVYVTYKKNYSFSRVVFLFFQTKIANSFYSKINDSGRFWTIRFWSGRSGFESLPCQIFLRFHWHLRIHWVKLWYPPLPIRFFRYQKFSGKQEGYLTKLSFRSCEVIISVLSSVGSGFESLPCQKFLRFIPNIFRYPKLYSPPPYL